MDAPRSSSTTSGTSTRTLFINNRWGSLPPPGSAAGSGGQRLSVLRPLHVRPAAASTTSDGALTILVATSVVRGSRQGESHGGVYVVDFDNQRAAQLLDWNTMGIDWQGRGWDRGLRGIAFDGEVVYIAASDELFAFTPGLRAARLLAQPLPEALPRDFAARAHVVPDLDGL